MRGKNTSGSADGKHEWGYTEGYTKTKQKEWKGMTQNEAKKEWWFGE
jgi:hypothetical protein